MKDRNVILQAVVGSIAYGLSTPTSDEDTMGVFVAPMYEVLGLSGRSKVDESIQLHEPDTTLHEVGKFARLALKCNPSITELLWMPEYTVMTPRGQLLLQMREACLSTGYVRNAYGGYASQQASRLLRRAQRASEGREEGLIDDLSLARVPKHARHCFRLMLQAQELLSTGGLTVNVGQHREELFELGELALSDPWAFNDRFNAEIVKVNTMDSVLPEQPNTVAAHNTLVAIRVTEFAEKLYAIGS